MKKIAFSSERIFLILLGLTFFIGTWHAFPMLNVVGDEMYYVGGVLRAIENHTMFPLANDVPYGTLTYLLHYIQVVFLLLLLLPFFGFNPSNLKLFLIQSPEVIYLSLRLMNAGLSLVILFFMYRLIRREQEDTRVRLFLVLLSFTTIVTAVILHTGKMWVLSTLLVLVSFHYLHESIKYRNALGEKMLRRNIFLSILFSFLALSNFPFNLYALLNLPVLVAFFRKDKLVLKRIFLYMLVGVFVYALVTLFNFEGIKNQIISIFTLFHPLSENFVQDLQFSESLALYSLKSIILFPLLFLTLIMVCRNGIKNRLLFVVSGLYTVVYFALLVLVANWGSDVHSYLRYLFPLGFFLTLLISSFNITFNKAFYAVAAVSMVFYIATLYYLSVPTTYNLAYAWVENNLSSKEVLIDNRVAELQLRKNKASSFLTGDIFCATKCKYIIDSGINEDFKPLVIDLTSKISDRSRHLGEAYYIMETPSEDEQSELIVSFVNKSSRYVSVDYNLGSYFSNDFLLTRRLGKDIYIYTKK